MRIYADQELNVLYIEGVSQGPCASYEFVFNADLVQAFRPQSQIYDFVNVPWYAIQKGDGVGLQSLNEAQSYLRSLTVPHFPLRFSVTYPLTITGSDVELDQQFINSIYMIDGGNS